MAAGVVVVERRREPYDLLGTEVRAQQPLGLVLLEAGVPPRVEHDLGGREHGSLSVDVDGAALEDEGRGEASCSEQVEDAPRHVARAAVLLVDAAVGVESPVHAGEASPAVGDERRRRVARPRVVAGHDDDVGAGDTGERAARRAGILSVHRHGDRLEARDRAGDLHERRARPLDVVPVLGAARPGQPAAGVRGPLGRHTKAGFSGRRHGSRRVVTVTSRSARAQRRRRPAAQCPAGARRARRARPSAAPPRQRVE